MPFSAFGQDRYVSCSLFDGGLQFGGAFSVSVAVVVLQGVVESSGCLLRGMLVVDGYMDKWGLDTFVWYYDWLLVRFIACCMPWTLLVE